MRAERSCTIKVFEMGLAPFLVGRIELQERMKSRGCCYASGYTKDGLHFLAIQSLHGADISGPY
jgi:hypothetical protein